KRLITDWHFQYVMILSLASLLVFWTFAESGERLPHGNFYWQIPICFFLVNLVLIKHLVQLTEIKKNFRTSVKAMHKPVLILFGAFSVHVLSGGVYLLKLLYFGSFS